MTEIQRVVDELRFLLQREVVEQSDELTSLLAKYSAQCREVNVRLRRCDECVKQGLRSEALHLADAAPNLLDAVAVLDFPERQQLLDVLSMYFLAPPEPLLLEVASALNEAYAQHEPLQKLLDSHRLLALGRSPLAERLPVLRSLAKLDEASPHWEVDVREMERARLREMDAESRAAMKCGDAATLKSLLGEAQTEGWREPVPAPFLRELKVRAGQASRARAVQRIKELNVKLHEAFAALDVSAARPLRDEWSQKQQIAQVSETDPLWEHVAPVFDWLAERDRSDATELGYVRAVAETEHALDNDHLTSAELKRLGLAVDRFERALPPSLESRYRSRLANLELSESRRRRLLIGAGFAAFATMVGLFGVVIHFSYDAEKTRRVAAAMASFIEEGKLDEARKLMEQHPPSTSEVWLATQKKLANAEQSEKDRVTRWRAEVETASSSTEAIRVEAALGQARQLARTTDEKIAVGKLQSTWQRRVSDEIAAREQHCREAIASATEALKELDAAIRDSRDSGQERLQELLQTADSRVAKLRLTQASVSNELGSQVTLLDSRLQASRKALAGLVKTSELLDQLTSAVLMPRGSVKAVGSADAYATVLREFANTNPNDPRAATFKAAADASPLPAVITRQILADRWKRMIPTDEKDVEARVREVQSYLLEYPQSPDRELMGRYEKWLASIQRRFADDGDPDEGAQRRLAALFNSKFIADGHVLRDTKGRTYYLTGPRDTPFGSIASFKYQAGFNGETKTASMSPTDLASPKTVPPPQAEIAKKVRTSSRSISLDKWSDHFLELSDTLRKAGEVDPFLRYLLVVKTLEFAGFGDHLLELELAVVLDLLNDDELDRTVAWMDPDNTAADKARERAKELLAKIPPLEPIFAKAAKRRELFEAELLERRFSVGWLEKKPGGDWACRTKWTPAGDHTLHAVSRSDSNGARVWLELGRVRDRSLIVDAAVSQTVGEGSAVFASPSKSESKTASLP